MASTKSPARKSRYSEAHPKAGISLLPKTPKQSEYLQALKASPQVIVTGPAGTGKTYIAATRAAQMYDRKEVSKIILTRPNVAAGRSLGFFPGTMEEKIAPWIVPFVEVLEEHLGKEVVASGMRNDNIQVVPFEVMRGRTFKDAFVILDEAQNATAHELKMFLSRIGENAQCVLNGDVMQTDLKDQSGLKQVIEMIRKQDLPVPVIEFSLEDIVRSDLCAMWIKAFARAKL